MEYQTVKTECDEIIKDVEDWLIANKTGMIIDKSFICRQIVNFAKRQMKF